MRGRVLIVAGSDSGGGAGIQADIKTVTALGGYAATAIAALTAQNTRGVFGVYNVPPAFVQQQMRLVLDDIGADAIKTGMLSSAEIIDAFADVIEERPQPRPALVIDPVMVAKSGDRLLSLDAVATFKRRLPVIADLITPNLPEAEVLSGMTIGSLDQMRHAAESMLTLGCRAVLLKGGHLPGERVVDLLVTEDGEEEFASSRIHTRHTHGTGCTLASAIATGMAQGMELRQAIVRARAYLQEAIRTAPGYGEGHGPLNHAHTVRN
jgi:hydroxymethylpyrimidine/phosphomethylpyrimidine kinase